MRVKRDVVLNVFGKWTEKVLKWRRQEERSRHACQRQRKHDVQQSPVWQQEHTDRPKWKTEVFVESGCRRLMWTDVDTEGHQRAVPGKSAMQRWTQSFPALATNVSRWAHPWCDQIGKDKISVEPQHLLHGLKATDKVRRKANQRSVTVV